MKIEPKPKNCGFRSPEEIVAEFVLGRQTFNEEYYIELHRLWLRIVRVRPEYSKGKQLFLLDDNASPHKTETVRDQKNRSCQCRPSKYSSDL